MGDFHQNFCEDALLSFSISNEKHLLAVMDGCSSGTDSHFASALIGKILKKVYIELSYLEFSKRESISLKEFQKRTLKGLFENLKLQRNQLHLGIEEILSTLILAIISDEKKAEIITIGDGLICCNKEYFEYEQDDRPDYLVYHLDEEFEYWFGNQTQVLSFSNVGDLSISTDGIFTFKNFNTQKYPRLEEEGLIDFLLKNKEGFEFEKMLHKKVIHLEKEYGLRPTDDLSILRVIFE